MYDFIHVSVKPAWELIQYLVYYDKQHTHIKGLKILLYNSKLLVTIWQ